MSKKLICFVSFVLVLSVALTGTAKAELIGWWRLDEGSGTTAFDFSGNGNDGALQNDAGWGIGYLSNSSVLLDGDDDFVEVPHADILTVDNEVSVMAWINAERLEPPGAGYSGIIAKSNSPRSYSLYTTAAGPLHFSTTSTVTNAFVGTTSSTNVPLNEWVHVAAVVVDGGHIYYMNGEEAGTGGADIELPGDADTGTVVIGRTHEGTSRSFQGLIDDARIYNHAVTQEDIQVIMLGEGWPFAIGPTPADGSIHEDTWVSLGWRAGDDAASHDVYFGESMNEVDEGAGDTFRGNQTETFFVVGFPGFPYPDGLVPGTIYYWRIDEVEADGSTKHKGEVWSFAVPPKTAYFPDPADGAQSVDPDPVLSWTAGFGAKLHYVYFGDNFDDVSNAAGALPQGTTEHTPGPLKMARTYYWRVDEFDVAETHKGNVWSFTTEGAVESLDPANGAVDVTQTPILTWTPGVNGASYEVYFGTDAASLELKGSGNLGSESYEPGLLEWNTTYYWRVDEANSTNADSPWTGPLWSFTTANFLIIDDMEAYNDLDPADPASNRIFNVWIDGFDNPGTNGSVVGHANPPFAEQTIVHSGNQSMPMTYDNAVGKSEATLTLTSNRDWTIKGVDTLTIWFRGDSGNAAEQMYVTLNGSARVDHDDPDAVTGTSWTEWNVSLQAFADQGVNLANVNSITLGLSSVSGGAGIMYFDDIRLYAPAQ
ncbi:MAG: LamG domain-containing protein [Planctomycetes bacterium]|nr:LamG domain-containing protein [Planctomycetota bacterium]